MSKNLINAIEHQVVFTESVFAVDNTFDDERFMRIRVAAMHDNINRNNSRFSLDVIKAAKDTFANIPILADVREYTDENGNKYLDYSGHSMHIEQDAFNEDAERIIYDEKVVGVVPETNNFEIVYDEATGNNYVYVDALLYREYGNYVCDILSARDNKTDVSMEIACDEVSFSAKDKCLDVGVMSACAITLLGASVTPGMAKAHAEVFSINEDDKNTQLIKIMQELKESLDNYTKTIKEGGNSVNHFEELLAKYGKTVEDITFEYELMSDEELDAKFAELFDEGEPSGDEESEPEGEANTSEDSEVSDEPIEESSDEPSEEAFEEATDNESSTDEPIESEESVDTVTPVVNEVQCSITYGETVKNFSVSLSDVIYALTQLVNDTYADEGSYYGVDVFADDKYVIMQDYWTGKAYKQSYKTKKDSYMLIGDRVSVKAVFLTEDEEKKLDEMRANYSAFEEVSTKLAQYEAEPQKMEIIEAECYKQIAQSDAYKEFAKMESHFDLSVDDVKAKCDEMLLNAAKGGELTFSVTETKPSITKKIFGSTTVTTNKKSRYGGLFDKK